MLVGILIVIYEDRLLLPPTETLLADATTLNVSVSWSGVIDIFCTLCGSSLPKAWSCINTILSFTELESRE